MILKSKPMISMKFCEPANKSIDKIKRKMKKNFERSGPIYGFFSMENGKLILMITHLIDKTVYSGWTTTRFKFSESPKQVKKYNLQSENNTKYIGTWHTHPFMDVLPSQKDRQTFLEIHNELKLKYSCYLILSNDKIYKTVIKGSTNEKKEITYKIDKF